MPPAYLLCGPSLAGKSRFAGELARRLGARVVSADAINEERGLPFGGEGLPESVWAETLRTQLDRITELAADGHAVVVDDTLCYRWLRDRLRAACAAAGLHAVLVVFRVDEAELLARRVRLVRSGERPVLGELRLREHLASFEWPTPEECPLEVATLRAQLGFGEAEPG